MNKRTSRKKKRNLKKLHLKRRNFSFGKNIIRFRNAPMASSMVISRSAEIAMQRKQHLTQGDHSPEKPTRLYDLN
jgi:hypothetical protein